MNPHDVQIHCCAVRVSVSVSVIGGSVPRVEKIGREDLDRAAEDYHAGPATTPRQAASIILLRGASDGLEVLLVKRNPAAHFMGGAWVFPGGAVDAGDEAGDAPHRAAAVRELAEEASVDGVDPIALIPFSRWITPAEVKTRFDTRFFLTPAPDGAEPQPDGAETVDAGWFEPQGALDAHGRGEILLVFPTIKHLEQLGGFGTADELLAYAEGREVRPVQPRVVVSGETARIVLPGEPGYEG
jgi:8-oxo-dGTP pyrophosphatase MutT (NUDIX family)